MSIRPFSRIGTRAGARPGRTDRHRARVVIAGPLAVTALLVAACTGTPSTDQTGSAVSSSVPVQAGAGQEADQAAAYQGGDAAGASTMALPSPTTAAVPTDGPAPAAGNISQEVPAQTVTTAAEQPADRPGDFGTGVTTAITAITAVDGVAAGPGESAAPGVAVTVEFTNGSDKTVGMDSVQVDLQLSDGTSASPLSGSPAAPLSGVLAPGEKRSGTYVFDVPSDQRSQFRMLVSYTTDAPVLQFTGAA